MPSFRLKVNKRTNHLSRFAKLAKEEVAKVVRTVAQDTVTLSRETMPVKTGSARASVYLITDQENTYQASSEEAASLNPKAEILPSEDPPGYLAAVISSCVGHMDVIENGNGVMPPRPIITEAFATATTNFEQKCADALTRARNGI